MSNHNISELKMCLNNWWCVKVESEVVFFLSEWYIKLMVCLTISSILDSVKFINTLLDIWESPSIPPFSIFSQECKTFHGVFVGSACGHHGPYIPDVLFWCVILFFTTFFLSSFLKQFKTKRYFPTKVMGYNFGVLVI